MHIGGADVHLSWHKRQAQSPDVKQEGQVGRKRTEFTVNGLNTNAKREAPSKRVETDSMLETLQDAI